MCQSEKPKLQNSNSFPFSWSSPINRRPSWHAVRLNAQEHNYSVCILYTSRMSPKRTTLISDGGRHPIIFSSSEGVEQQLGVKQTQESAQLWWDLTGCCGKRALSGSGNVNSSSLCDCFYRSCASLSCVSRNTMSSSFLTFRETNVAWARKTGISEAVRHLSYNLRIDVGQAKAGKTVLLQMAVLQCCSLKWTKMNPLLRKNPLKARIKQNPATPTVPNHIQ